MNFYIYGPKEDPYHRIKWSELYPEEELNNFRAFHNEALKLGIKPYFSLSPGMSYGKSESENLDNLIKKFKQLNNIGFTDFAIFFDDIDSVRDDKLGVKHSLLLEQVSNFFENESSSPLMFCPTVYCNSFANGSLVNCSYLQSLSERVPPNLHMLWTGNEVVSKTISDQDINTLKQVISNLRLAIG